MRQFLIILFLVLNCLASFSQTKNKFILNFNAHRNDFARPKDNQFKHHFWFPSIEYLRKKGKRIWSFELAKFTRKSLGSFDLAIAFPRIVYKNENTQALLRVQYQRLTQVIISDVSYSVNPYYGIALTPHYAHTDGQALIPNLTAKDITSMGLTTHASLGFYWQLRRFFFNVNSLIGLGQMEFVTTETDDPTLPLTERQATHTKIKVFPNDRLFRIGIGFGI